MALQEVLVILLIPSVFNCREFSLILPLSPFPLLNSFLIFIEFLLENAKGLVSDVLKVFIEAESF